MEMGAFGLDIGAKGSPNGSTFAYFVYFLIPFLITFKILSRIKLSIKQIKFYRVNFRLTPFLVVTIFFFFTLVFFYVWLNGFEVVLGNMTKQEARANLGNLGAINFMLFKYIIPSLLAYITFLYLRKKNLSRKILWTVCLLFAALIGLSRGFKSTAIFMLLPSAIIYFWHAKLRTVLFLFFGTILSLVILAVIFDNKPLSNRHVNLLNHPYSTKNNNALNFILYRATVMQGNVGWKIWSLYNSDNIEVNYKKTLLAVVGDRVLKIWGINYDNISEFEEYHYTIILSRLAGVSYSSLKSGHSIYGGLFSEGIIAGGKIGVIGYSILAAFLAYIVINVLRDAYNKNNPLITSLAAVYFSWGIVPWIQGGNIVRLFHIQIVISLLITYFFLFVLNKLVYKSEKTYVV